MTIIPSTPGVAGASPGPTAPTPAPASGGGGLNQLANSQTFLQLLVAQLKNQDPLNPSDPTSFMTEIAQLTAVQSQTSLATDELTVAADSMLGRTVSGTGSTGATVSGNVTGVILSSSAPPELQLVDSAGATQVMNLSSVAQVYQSSPPGTSSSSSGPSTGSVSTTA